MDIKDLSAGDRVELAPHTDTWMAGDRYATVTRVGTSMVWLRMDRTQTITKRHPSVVGRKVEADTTIQIPMSDSTKRFYQGVASADEVARAHADLEFPDFETRARTFWFYVGVLAAGEHGCTSQDDFTNFVSGAATRAPRDDEED